VLQDRRGMIYVGNSGGLLEFDGIEWRLIEIPNRLVRSMATDETGTIYIGGKNEIGYLAPAEKGTLKYVSLLPHLEENKRNFSHVWSTRHAKEGTYFMTSKFLFRWDGKQMKTWESEGNFTAAFVCRNRLFVRQKTVGLMEMENDFLKHIPGGDAFGQGNIAMMTVYGTKEFLIGNRNNNLYIYDGKTVTPFPTEVDNYLKKNQLYRGIHLKSQPGEFVLGTRLGGVAVIDSKGRLKRMFNKDSGLQDSSVKYIFEDFQGNLWLALNSGITKIENASPISVYDERSELKGIVLSVIKHRDILYAGTTSGLFFLVEPSTYQKVQGISSCWSLLSAGDSLLAATGTGVFQVDSGNNTKQKIIEGSSFVLHSSKSQPHRVWVGTASGLMSIYRGENSWREELRYKTVTHSIRTIVENRQGDLWLGIEKGVLKVDFPGDGTITHPAVTFYGASHGLPDSEIRAFNAAGHVMFAADKGIFRFDEKNKSFVPDETLGSEFIGGGTGAKKIFRIAEDKNNYIWLHAHSRNIRAIPRTDGSYKLLKKPYLMMPLIQVNEIYPDPGGDIVWFAGNNGLICYDTTVKRNYDFEFHTLIRRVLVNGKPVFDGYANESNTLSPIFPYKERNLRFKFAAAFYQTEDKTRYQYKLEGYEEDWSAWTPETQKDYTNLDSGSYTFKVRARNIYETISNEAVFKLKILPPWYYTWWAFSIYTVFLFITIFLVVRWRSWKLEQEKRHLESIVKERTHEIKEKNIQLEVQSEKLKEMDKVKSRFFANISHEFRTPLTLIMGPLEQMLSREQPDTTDGKEKKKLKLMLRNSQRLLNLINQLMDLSKFESGKMKLKVSPQNIVAFVKGITASFEIAAEQHELDLQFQAQEDSIILYFDSEKLEKVMGNLLSNAIKFTPPGGKVTVTVNKNTDPDDAFPSGSLEISVCDTGIGIETGQLPHIFDHFYQVDASRIHELKEKGSGIGLSLAKELVTLHQGQIDVRSRKEGDSGTCFTVRLPLGNQHLAPGETIDDAEPPPETEIQNDIPAHYMETVEKEEEKAVQKEGIQSAARQNDKNIILIVEDSPDVREYIKSTLESHYTVLEAGNGKEGIDKALETIPDLIISDIMMPELDGYELCRVLKKDVNTSHVPIILLSAKASEESIVEGLVTGADDYITKPFNAKILSVRVKNLIDLRSQLQLKIKRQNVLQPAEINVSSVDETFLKDLQDVIEKNLSDSDFNVEELSKKLYMSRASLYRKIMAITGESPNHFIRSYRLKRAAQLLQANFGNVTEVALEVGFSNMAHFSKCFKEAFHQLPSTYQAAKNN
jgi:signal transduction histidine kinase/DNA-binding response OmpR family regulator/ligand-binding sensor domain-containing protein